MKLKNNVLKFVKRAVGKIHIRYPTIFDIVVAAPIWHHRCFIQ